MPFIQTRCFGIAEYETDSVFRFPAGIPGFDDERAFVFLKRPETEPLLFMHSLEDPNLCLILLPVLAADPDYRLHLGAEDRAELELPLETDLQIGSDIFCGVIVCVADESRERPTANLLAPIVLNVKQMIGLQIIQTKSGYSHQHCLTPSREEALC